MAKNSLQIREDLRVDVVLPGELYENQYVLSEDEETMVEIVKATEGIVYTGYVSDPFWKPTDSLGWTEEELSKVKSFIVKVCLGARGESISWKQN